jgi:hypothetical protein
MDLAIRPEFAHALLNRLADFQIKLTSFVIERIGEYIDVVKVANDIGTQEVLPTGSVQQIEVEVHKNMETFKPGGGYVFSQVHNITHDVPVENVVTMFEAYHNAAF